VAARARQIADARARDGGRHGQHDRAELAEVVPAEHRLGSFGHLDGLGPAGRGQDHRAEHAVQQVLGHDRAAGQAERPIQQPPGLRVVALGQPDLGQPLQRVRLAGGGPELSVSGAGFGQLGHGQVQVAGQQRRLAGQRPGERGGPPGPAPLRGPAQVPGQLHDLGVRRRPVQQVLGRAQVAVEDGAGHAGILPGPVQLGSHLGEPLIRTMREQPPQRDEIEHLPIALTREDQPLRLLRRDPGRVEVGGEERVLAPGQEDVGVVGAAVGVESVQGGCCRGEVAGHDRAVRQPGAQPPRIGGTGSAERFPVGRPCHRVADRGEQVGTQRERPGPAEADGVWPDRVDQRQRVAVSADGGFRLGRSQQVRHGVGTRAGRQEVVADADRRGAQLD
jgi:hypothetical protein